MNPRDRFRLETISLLQTVLDQEDIKIKPDLEKAPERYGDMAFPCFPLAKTQKRSPDQIAKDISDQCNHYLERNPSSYIDEVNAVKAYVNFHFNKKELTRITLESILQEGNSYGMGEKKNIHIILEHTSANPNGPFHVGRARNPIIGDTLARILRHAGYDVTTEYYVNDMGKQAVILTWGIENLSESAKANNDIDTVDKDIRKEAGHGHPHMDIFNTQEKMDHRYVRFYQQASQRMEHDSLVLQDIDAMLERYERGDVKIGESVKRYCVMVLEGMKQTLQEIHIHIDNYVFESDFVFNGDVTQVINKLKESPVSMEEDGAYYLELKGFGIHGRDTRFFYTRKEGTSLYTTRDLAYHRDKFKRGDRVVNILGEDHKLQSQQLAIALGELGETRRPEIAFYAFVSLPEGKMSTRRGRVVYLDHLIEEALNRAYLEVNRRRSDLSLEEKRRIARFVGIGAIRYNIARVQMEKSLIFKWDEALNFEGDSAPFIQYTHARACSILRKGGDGFVIGVDGFKNEGDEWKNEGDRLKNEGDEWKNEGDRLRNEGDGLKNEGDGLKNKGDGLKNEGDELKREGDELKSERDELKNEGDGLKNEGDELGKVNEKLEIYLESSSDLLIDPNEEKLIRSLTRFPDVVQECANGLKIHPLASYLRDTAQLFNQFYRECPVLTAKKEVKNARLVLVDAFRIVMAKGLDLMGITAPDYM